MVETQTALMVSNSSQNHSWKIVDKGSLEAIPPNKLAVVGKEITKPQIKATSSGFNLHPLRSIWAWGDLPKLRYDIHNKGKKDDDSC